MVVLIIGGSGSGKSEYAENYAVEQYAGEKTYIATMRPGDMETQTRITRHRKQREHKNFITYEVFGRINCEHQLNRQITLFECMSNYISNLVFWEKLDQKMIISDVKHMLEFVTLTGKDLILVSNSVSYDGYQYEKGTLEFIKLFTEINQIMAESADKVIEIVCGIPVVLKERLSCTSP